MTNNNVVNFNKESIKLFEIWDKDTKTEDHNMKELYRDEMYIEKENFEDLQDLGYEFKYVYTGQVLGTFDEFQDFMING